MPIFRKIKFMAISISCLFLFDYNNTSAMDYQDIRKEESNKQIINKLLSPMFANQTETSDCSLYDKVNSKSNLDNLVWSLFSYCVLSETYFDLPFDALLNVAHNMRCCKKQNISLDRIEEMCRFLFNVFYASKYDYSLNKFVRDKSEALQILNKYLEVYRS